MNCDNCKNTDICKYEESAREFEKNMQAIPHPDLITSFVTCKKFRSKIDGNVLVKKVAEEIKNGKDVPTIAKEFNVSESKVRYIKKSSEGNN